MTTVVIAEDEAIVRLDLREVLEEEGYQVIGETGRGDEALDLITELKPDIALLDIKMPGMDGLSVARRITPLRQTAVLILTAFSQRNSIEEARDAGTNAYLIKPFQRTELIPAIEVALARFREDQHLGEDSEGRMVVAKAKAKLMDDHGLSEAEAVSFVHDAGQSEAGFVDRAHQVNAGTLKP